jgi:hypothetical protein
MFCPKCRCEFVGWTDECPDCKIPLVEALPSGLGRAEERISYEALVDLVKESGSQLSIDLSVADVGVEKQRGFPYRGYGFAWAKRMRGAFNKVPVDLVTSEVGREKKESFPYFGYGFAWSKRMEGHIGGNAAFLIARKVVTERERGFPYAGYGFAWTEELSGECGAQLKLDLKATEVARSQEKGFPYSGYGLAWMSEGMLTLTLSG